MPLKTVFFDAAGTLISPAEPVGSTYAHFAARHGVLVKPEGVMGAFREVWKATSPPLYPVGRTADDDDREWWRSLVGAVFLRALGQPLPESTLSGLFDELYFHYAQPEAWSVFDDVVPALSDLAVDHRLLVLSNFDRRLRDILAGHGLLSFFERVIISSEVGAAKPHPRMFQAALKAADSPPDHCLHVGDDVRCDLEGAEDSRIPSFHVKRPENGLDVLVQKVRTGAYSGLHWPLL
ncbi:HAD-IA family hydrolase [Prosthecobacter sp.]|uniref:HAD-IA family hydrolase n=1 Tax=Prosthecobacter sp. TaxID=1965333 RepID=UPI001E1982BA|nr:HAD-IA family hydrolase [Prosthecobacter sp.]MCB1276701.1 HAD-IA family hydrolase [Prosthecobacter sp.]